MYNRKTVDEYRLMGDCGLGYEVVLSETTKKEAFAQLKTYEENERGISFKIIKKRVKKD